MNEMITNYHAGRRKNRNGGPVYVDPPYTVKFLFSI